MNEIRVVLCRCGATDVVAIEGPDGESVVVPVALVDDLMRAMREAKETASRTPRSWSTCQRGRPS